MEPVASASCKVDIIWINAANNLAKKRDLNSVPQVQRVYRTQVNAVCVVVNTSLIATWFRATSPGNTCGPRTCWFKSVVINYEYAVNPICPFKSDGGLDLILLICVMMWNHPQLSGSKFRPLTNIAKPLQESDIWHRARSPLGHEHYKKISGLRILFLCV